MSTLAIEMPRRRVTDVDFLMLAMWTALMVLMVAKDHLASIPWGMVCGFILIVRHFYESVYLGEERDTNLVLAVVIPVAALIQLFVFARVTHPSSPVTYDALLASWDHGFGPAVRAWALPRAWAWTPIAFVYNVLPIAIPMTLAVTSGRKRMRLFLGVTLGALFVIPCYMLFPAVGPIHVGDPNAPRNCMPSMHLTWALLLWVATQGWLKWVMGVFAFITAVAVLATGEHYLPDLIAAVPWTIFLTLVAAELELKYRKAPHETR